MSDRCNSQAEEERSFIGHVQNQKDHNGADQSW